MYAKPSFKGLERKVDRTMSKLHSFPLILFVFLLLLSGGETTAQTAYKVLFLGNSYTSTNNLPQIVKDVAASAGDVLSYDSYTPGGFGLSDHDGSTTSEAKIMAGGWDYIVLQGQSQESIAAGLQFKNSAHALNSLITEHTPCSVVMTYMTWGRKNGDATLCPIFPITCTYEGMDTTTRNNYLDLTNRLGAEVSPVSVVWSYLRNNHPGIELYQQDGSHPSPAGSYAAACCFYSAMYKKDPTLITFDNGLNAADAATIRDAVKMVVFNNLSAWDYKRLPESNFWYQIGAGLNQVSFLPNSAAQTYFWDFGDGNTSSVPYPTHSYAADGSYTVTYTTTNCDLDGLHTSTTDTIIQFCAHTPSIYTDSAWVCQRDTLWTQPADAYQWLSFNAQGAPLPETNQYLADFEQYNIGAFSVSSTIAGCTEMSQVFSALPEWSGYYFDLVPFGDPCEGDTSFFRVLYAFSDSGNLISGDEVIRWYKDGQLLPLNNDKDTLLITTTGTFECKVANPASNCPDDTTRYQFTFEPCVIIGVEDHKLDLSWKLFPNPASESVTIQLGDGLQHERVQIFSAIGRLVKELDVTTTTQLNIADLPNGFYFVRLKDRPQAVLKFIKQ